MATPPSQMAKFQRIMDQIAQLPDPKAKQVAWMAYFRGELEADYDADKPQDHLHLSLPGGRIESPHIFTDADNKSKNNILDSLEQRGMGASFRHDMMIALTAMAEKPLERLPCANVEPMKDWRCHESGRLACSGCKLVSYCSKECQRSHWRTHKQDCKDPIRSPQWQPAWIREMREPTFMQNSPGWRISREEQQFALGLHIWGNIPAMDTLNLVKNEGKSAAKSNMALAYVASGDLRDVIRTINELPSDYSGELTILLNDREPTIVLRNMLLLMILGTVEDTTLAADVALHFWCSAYVQMHHAALYPQMSMQLLAELRQHNQFSVKLGENSVMTGAVSEPTISLLARMTISELDLDDASDEMRRIRFEPTRQDRHHRNYVRLNPSHRLAQFQYRRFGLVLPFGAANNNFNTPNRFLFSPDGKWLTDDLATPLESWNIEDVVQAGKAHGAQPDDLYGCLYFYLSDQLRSFAERIKKFRLSFRMFDQDVRELAKKLRLGAYEAQSLPRDISFDRIHVSNIIDTEYVGIANVLADWTPFLNKTNRCATIIAYSMNWVPKQHNSEPGSDKAVMGRLVNQLLAMGKISQGIDEGRIPAIWKYFVALYDNSAAFDEYLKAQGADEAARKAGAKLKVRHSIVPHRICAPIDGSGSALPTFSTEDSWYWNVQVGSALLSERFVEFSRV